MGKKKESPDESFITSTEEVKEELEADVAAETEGTDDGGLAEGDPAEGPEGGEEPVPVGEGEVTTPFTSDGNGPTSYVTPEPDKISSTFTRNLPVAVPDEELAEHAKEMARLHHLWVDTKLKAKAFTKSCKGITDKAEEDMVALGAIIQEGMEERPVICRWEFDYRAGIKKLRRLDTFKIVLEETLTGDELHMSFNFNGSSEAAVEKLAEVQAGAGDTPLTDDPTEAEAHAAMEAVDRPYRPCNGTEGEAFMSSFCYRCAKDLKAEEDPAEGCQIIVMTMAHDTDDSEYPKEWVTNERDGARCTAFQPIGAPEVDTETLDIFQTEQPQAPETPATEPAKEPSAHACKLCGFDGKSHVYLVRHLRDTHDLKLSDYKKQFPAEK